jgi:hypothetical protein
MTKSWCLGRAIRHGTDQYQERSPHELCCSATSMVSDFRLRRNDAHHPRRSRARAGRCSCESESVYSGKGLKPGDGPSKEERETGFYDVVFTGIYPDGRKIVTSVYGDRDPGYGSTSKMISEAALALLETKSAGGVFTPGGVIAAPLVERLQKYAGLKFKVE